MVLAAERDFDELEVVIDVDGGGVDGVSSSSSIVAVDRQDSLFREAVRGHHQHRAGECHSEHQVRRLSDQVVRRSLFFTACIRVFFSLLPIHRLYPACCLHLQMQGDSWWRTARLAFQCVGILYGDVGTSPLYVYSTAFDHGVGHPDDILGVLSLIIYSFLLFTVIKIVFVALHANDDGDGQLITLLLVFFLTDGRQGLC